MKKSFVAGVLSSLTLATLLMSGCAKNPDPTANDPLEGYNKVMFAFNQDVDHMVMRPVATVYSKITPPPLQEGVTNFFNNINEFPTFGNDLLQGNFRYLFVDVWRLAINTTLGVGGLFDVATRLGIRPHIESLGLTIAKWRGGKQSPYFVVPILGPSSIQGAFSLAADYFMTPLPYFVDQNINYGLTGLWLVSARAQYLPADKLVDSSFDPYIFVRDAYMQNEKAKIAQNEALNPVPQPAKKEDINMDQRAVPSYVPLDSVSTSDQTKTDSASDKK